MTVKADFLISPAYSVPTMMISIRRRWTRIAVSVRVPSVAGSALNEGTQMIVKLGANGGEVLGRRPAEQVPGEDARPGRLRVDAQRAPMGRGRADVQVLGVQRPVGGVRDEACPEPVVVLLADRPIDLAPPDLALAPGLLDDELVLRGAARVPAGPDDERPLGRDDSLAGPDRVLVQLGHGQVGPDRAPQRVTGGRSTGGMCRGGPLGGRAHRGLPDRGGPARPARVMLGSSTGRAWLGNGGT